MANDLVYNSGKGGGVGALPKFEIRRKSGTNIAETIEFDVIQYPLTHSSASSSFRVALEFKLPRSSDLMEDGIGDVHYTIVMSVNGNHSPALALTYGLMTIIFKIRSGGQFETIVWSFEGFIDSDETSFELTGSGDSANPTLFISGHHPTVTPESFRDVIFSVLSIQANTRDSGGFLLDESALETEFDKLLLKGRSSNVSSTIKGRNNTYVGHGATTSRPTVNLGDGARYYDTTLNEWVFFNGTAFTTFG